MNGRLMFANIGAGSVGVLTNFFLIFAALLPAIILCVYVYKKDRVEKEPMGLLIKLLLGGATIGVFGAIILEIAFKSIVLKPMFADFIIGYDRYGEAVFADSVRHVKNFIEYFFGVGLIEEGIKLAILIMFTRKNKEFNSLFDGIIYSIFVSLGFAALENVFYVLENGFVNAIMRGLLSVPGHMFFAVLMGYYYSLWHITDKATQMEKMYKSLGLIHSASPEFKSRKYVVLALVVPTIVHGAYDFGLTFGTMFAFVLVIALIMYMYVYCFGRIRKMSASDAPSDGYAYAMVIKKYPTLPDLISARNAEFDEQKAEHRVRTESTGEEAETQNNEPQTVSDN